MINKTKEFEDEMIRIKRLNKELFIALILVFIFGILIGGMFL
jgi:hypothetical protein